MPVQKVRVGIVGVGLAALSHYQGYAAHPRAEVVAVCDLNRRRAEAFAAERGIPKVFGSFEELAASPEVDAVDIATPTHLHAAMTLQAAEGGKHVHCEKPFCRNLGEGRKAWEAVRARGLKLVVGETYVFISSHMKARELIEEGVIGRPLQVRQRHGAWLERKKAQAVPAAAEREWRLDPVLSGGGEYPWIFDHAVHFFSSAEYFLPGSRILEVFSVKSDNRALARRSGAAHDPYSTAERDIPIITWRFEDPACQGVWMRAERLNGKYDFLRGFSTTIVGETGMIEVLGEGGHNLLWDGRQQHLILHREGKPVECFRFEEGGDEVWDSDICYYSKGHVNQVHHFVDCVLNDKPPRYSGEEGLHAVACTLAAIRSAMEDRQVRVSEIGPEFAAYGGSEIQS
jgi:predicted dehydrogenase